MDPTTAIETTTVTKPKDTTEVFGINRSILIAIVVIWNLFLLITTLIFIYLRANLTIKFRNVPLTIGGVLSTVLVSNTYYTTILYPQTVPCYFVLWVLSLGAPFWFLTFFGKFFLLAFSYQHARSKMHADDNRLMFNNLNSSKDPFFNPNRNSDTSDSAICGGASDITVDPTDPFQSPLSTANTVTPSSKFHLKRSQPSLDKVSRLRGSNLKDTELGRNWYHQNRNRWTTQSVLVCIVIILGFHAIVAAITQWLAPEYATYAPKVTNCIKGYGMIPLFITAIVYFGVGGPMLTLLMWKAKDAYLLKLELILLVASTSPFILMFLIFTYVEPLGVSFYPATFLLMFHLFTHLASIVLPSLDVYRSGLKKTPTNFLKFHNMLNDKDMFLDFKEFTVNDFTVENPLFFEAYKGFLEKYDQSYKTNKDQANYFKSNEVILLDGKCKNANDDGIDGDGLLAWFKRWIKFNPKNSTNPNNLPLSNLENGILTSASERSSSIKPPITIIDRTTVPPNVTTLTSPQVRDLMFIYNKFVAPNSDYQLNLVGATVKHIQRRIEEQDFDIHMFDAIMDEVIDSMYRNTYVRYIKFQQF